MKQYWVGKHNYSGLYGILSKGALKFFLEIHATSFGRNLIHANLSCFIRMAEWSCRLHAACSLQVRKHLFLAYKNK